MKKFTTSLFISIVFPVALIAQWTSISSGTAGKLESVYFWNTLSGIMSHSGQLIRTSDGGLTWTVVSGANYGVRDIDFADATTGYAAGVVGDAIKKTTNGGNTWSPLTPPTSNSLWGVSVPAPNICYVSGTGGVVWKTTTGSAFTTVNLPVTELAVDIDFVSTTEGYVLTQQAGVYKTVNGGTTWTHSYSSTGCLYTSIYFLDSQIGFACGSNGRIIRTTDGGNNWTILTTNSQDYLQYIHFFNSTNGICVGFGGVVLRTVDGGTTWFYDNIPVTTNLYACILLSPSVALVAGENGTMYRNGALGISVNEIASVPLLNGYPNPCKEVFILDSDALPKNADLQLNVFSVDGKFSASLTPATTVSKYQFDVAILPEGIYLGELYDRGNRVAVVRFMKVDKDF